MCDRLVYSLSFMVVVAAVKQIYVERLFPYQEAGKIQLIREYGQLLSEEYTEDGILVKARVPGEIYTRVV